MSAKKFSNPSGFEKKNPD